MYEGLKLTLSLPTSKPTVKYDVKISSSVAELKVRHDLVKEFLPYSWIELEVPKTNKEYEPLKNSHSVGGAIPPTPFFLTTAGSLDEDSVKLECYLNGIFQKEEKSIDLIYNPNLTAWTSDVIQVMFGDVFFDNTKCDYIEYTIPSM